MIIYLDSDFKCHLTNETNSYLSIETDFFNDKCEKLIEGYRFVPEGSTWTRGDGVVFTGEMVCPAEDYNALDKAQQQYEIDGINFANELGALIEEIYNEDLEIIG